MSKKLNILLTTFNIHAQQHYYSLALGFLKSFTLKDPALKEKVNIEILDFCSSCHENEQVLFYLTKMKPDLIGFSVYCWNAEKIFKLAALVKQMMPETMIAVGGPEVGPIDREVMENNPSIDFLERGEGEATFAALLTKLTSGKKVENVKGLTYRNGNEIVRNEERPLIDPLDEIPSPYLTGTLVPRDWATYLESYRGCPFECGYCFEGKNYPKIRSFSKERLRAEVELLESSASVNRFSFIDPVFNLSKDRLKMMAEILKSASAKGKKLHTIELNVESVDDESIKLLKICGVESIETGPQTFNPKALKAVSRKIDPKKFSDGIALLKQNGIKVLSDLIIGLPEDGLLDFMESTRLVMANKPDTVIFSTLHVLPGTQLYEDSAKAGLIFDRSAPHCILSTTKLSYNELKKAEVLAESLRKEYNT